MLLDPGSFQEIGMFAGNGKTGSSNGETHLFGDGVVTGSGTINGRLIYIFSQDFTVLGGSVGRVHGKKIARIIDLATQNGAPLIGLNDSGGARIQEGVNSLAAYGDIFYRNVKASGVIPQISIILGPCAGGAVYSPAITDFVVMVDRTSQMFITGPNVIKEVTKEDIDLESLGGSLVHHNQSGVAHLRSDSEDGAFSLVRTLISYLPSNNLAGAPSKPSLDEPGRLTGELDKIVPQ
jgi:acetyl-CoA carboxylase carboxyltransferase component